MSKPQIFSVLDPRLDIRTKTEIVQKGADNISFQQFIPNTVSNSSIQITCNPPSRNIGVSRNVSITATYSVAMTFSNVPSGQVPLPAGYWGVRQFPYTSTVSSHQISLNNDLYAVSPVNQINRAMAHYYDDFNERNTIYSKTASMLDQSQNYSDIIGGAKNPLALSQTITYDQSRNDSDSNGGVIISGVTGNTTNATSASFTVTVTEPLMFLSPLLQGFNGTYGNCLFGIDEMTYSATFSNLNRILSISTSLPATITGLTVTLTSASLLFQYFKVKDNYQIPRSILYPYYSMTLYQTSPNVSISPNSQGTLVTNNIQLVGIPKRLFIWAGLPDSVYNTGSTAYTSTDTFLALQKINSLTFNTNQYLAQATQQDLYEMSVKNGNRLSFVQWTSGMGSVLCLDLAEDVGLTSYEAVGVSKNIQLSVSTTYKNTNQTLTITPNLFVLVVYDGSFSMREGFVSRSINNLTESDVISAPNDPNISYKDLQSIYGDGFFSDLWNGIKKVGSFVRPVLTPLLDVAQHLHPKGPPVREAVRAITGVGRTGGAQTGGAQTGGRGYMSKAELMRNMDRY